MIIIIITINCFVLLHYCVNKSINSSLYLLLKTKKELNKYKMKFRKQFILFGIYLHTYTNAKIYPAPPLFSIFVFLHIFFSFLHYFKYIKNIFTINNVIRKQVSMCYCFFFSVCLLIFHTIITSNSKLRMWAVDIELSG